MRIHTGSRGAAAAGLMLAMAVRSNAQTFAPTVVDVESIELSDTAGHTYKAERGRVRVLENRERANGHTLEVGYVRVKAPAPSSRAPIVFLNGGPGQAGSPMAESPQALNEWSEFLSVADVIFLDQRGTGTSRPNLDLPFDESLPQRFFADRDVALAYAIECQRRCKQHFEAQGIDLAAYNTAQNADDVDDLRAALALPKISVLGFSYGTLLGLTTVRRHRASLERVVLVGTEGPNDWGSLPTTLQTQIDKLSLLAAKDASVNHAVPNLRELLERVLSKLEHAPLDVEVLDRRTHEPVVVPLGRVGLEFLLRIDLGDGNDFPLFPALLWTLDQGRTDVVQRLVEKRYNQLSRGSSGMSSPMSFGSWPAPWLLARFALERDRCVLRDMVNYFDLEVADVWNVPALPADFRAPIVTDVPTLFVSGTLDSNAPPYQAETMRFGFVDSVHLVVENAGHEDMLPDPAVRDVIRRFFAGEDVRSARVAQPTPTFVGIRKK